MYEGIVETMAAYVLMNQWFFFFKWFKNLSSWQGRKTKGGLERGDICFLFFPLSFPLMKSLGPDTPCSFQRVFCLPKHRGSTNRSWGPPWKSVFLLSWILPNLNMAAFAHQGAWVKWQPHERTLSSWVTITRKWPSDTFSLKKRKEKVAIEC